MKKELKERLLAEIDKSGFSHEISVVEKIVESDITVFPNISYTDREGKPHEIDAIAYLENHEREEKQKYGYVSLNLLIECKSSQQRPWVFFQNDFDVRTWMGLVDRLAYSSDLATKESNSILIGCMNTALGGHHYNNKAIPSSRTYFEAFGKDAGREIYQAATNIWYTLDFFKRVFEENSKSIGKESRTIFYHPVVVFQGTLVAATKTQRGYSIREVPHVLLRTTDTLTYKGLDFITPQRETIIDVIHEKYLNKYIDLCKEDLIKSIDHLNTAYDAGWVKKNEFGF